MVKKIWIVNYYTGSPVAQANPRYIQLAKHFMAAGYDVVTFNSTIREPQESKEEFVKRQYADYKFVHVKSPEYKGNGVKRMLSIFSFAWKIFRNCNKFERPDIVLHNIHTPFDYPVYWAARRLGAKYIAEGWDLWPDDFVSHNLISKNNPLMKLAYTAEKNLYYHSDELIFTLKGIYDYLNKKGWTQDKGGKIDVNHVHYINNGINLEDFEKNKISYPRSDEDLNDSNTLKIIYLGSVNKANNVQTLIDAAAVLQKESNIKFFIYGDGRDREYLENYVHDKHLTNVTFKEKRITFEECAWVVSQADINILNYGKNFGRWGESSGKLRLYLAAGKPIVCNRHFEYEDIISEHNLGIAKNLTTAEDFANEIRHIASMPKKEYDEMCERVKLCAKEFDYEVLAARELKVIEQCLNSK